MAIARRYGGHVLAAWKDGEPIAVAIVFDPGHHDPPVQAIIHHLDFTLFGPGAVVRGLQVLTAMRRAHLEEPHVWLDALGVHPAHQRSGAGGALVEEVVARSERFGVPAFLHTTRPENPAYYRRFGFDVVSEGALPRGKRFWSLLRPL
jgi:ribosomal protein S18 acetylase RimI-like enzyme